MKMCIRLVVDMEVWGDFRRQQTVADLDIVHGKRGWRRDSTYSTPSKERPDSIQLFAMPRYHLSGGQSLEQL